MNFYRDEVLINFNVTFRE